MNPLIVNGTETMALAIDHRSETLPASPSWKKPFRTPIEKPLVASAVVSAASNILMIRSRLAFSAWSCLTRAAFVVLIELPAAVSHQRRCVVDREDQGRAEGAAGDQL